MCVCVCVCVSKHYTAADVSSATLFALLQGPSVHVGLEAKNVCLLSAGDGGKGQKDNVWTDGSPAVPLSGLMRLKFALTDFAFSSIFAASPASLSAVVGFCTLILIHSLSPFEHRTCLFVESLPLISMNLVPLQSINNPPFFPFFKNFVCCANLYHLSCESVCFSFVSG